MVQPSTTQISGGFWPERETAHSQPDHPALTTPKLDFSPEWAAAVTTLLADEQAEQRPASFLGPTPVAVPVAHLSGFECELRASLVPLPRHGLAEQLQEGIKGWFPDLTPDEEQAMGLAEALVLLAAVEWESRGMTFEFWRCFRDEAHVLTIRVPELDFEKRITLTPTPASAKDRFRRYQLKLRELFDVPHLMDYLLWSRSRVLNSIKYQKNSKAVIVLARLIHAVTYPSRDIFWDRAAGDDRWEIDHINQCASDDRAQNLRRLTVSAHRTAQGWRVAELRRLAAKGVRWTYYASNR